MNQGNALKCFGIMIQRLLIRHGRMILASILFFYLGCGFTIGVLKSDCDNEIVKSSQSYSASDFDKVEYAVLVMTGPSNEPRRNAIRTTWGKFPQNIVTENDERIYRWNHSWTKPNADTDFIKIFYPVGTKSLSNIAVNSLLKENSRSKDLIFLDIEDAYENLSSKLLESVKWLHTYLPKLKYLIKCDDDTFMRIDLIVRDLEIYAPSMDAPELNEYISAKRNEKHYDALYWGYFDGRAKVYLSGKWGEKDWFLCDHYLPYALGGAYVISQRIVEFIAKNSEFLSLYNSEDVSMGVWTAALSKVNRVHDVRFDTEWKSRGCQDYFLVMHKQTPSSIFELYTRVVKSKGKSMCAEKVTNRLTYVYQWNVLPSNCCNKKKVV